MTELFWILAVVALTVLFVGYAITEIVIRRLAR
jgi:hypothetical protein